jgi:hypothetical protein
VYKTVSEHFEEVVVNKYLNWFAKLSRMKKEESSYLYGFYSMFCWTCYLLVPFAKLVIPFFILGCYFVIKNQNRNQNFDGGSLYNRQQ